MDDVTTGPARRKLVAGALWAVPTVMAAAAAPAAAASTCPPGCPTAGFGGALNANGWSVSTVGTFAQGANQRVGYYASYTPWSGTDACTGATGGTAAGTLTNAIVGEADPVAAGASITYARTICLVAGVTYTFQFSWNYYGINSRAAFLNTQLLSPSSAIVASATQVTATGGTANAQGTRRFSYTATVTGTYTYKYVWTFGTSPTFATSGCNSYANDIAVQAPTITCSPTP